MDAYANLYINPEYVKRRPWTNWNDNWVVGSKITMPKETAEVLNIFLGIFIFFIEAGLWGPISFALFCLNRRLRKRTSSSLRDGLYHQLQAVLRNTASSLAIAVTLVHISRVWGWRKSWKRTLLVILVALFSFSFFVIGMPFILAKTMLDGQGDEILIQAPNCGFWQATFDSSDTTAATLLTNQSWEAVMYVDTCYNGDAPSTLCDRYLAQRRLPTFELFANPCPFAEDICLYKNKYPAYKWQTEKLDSHKDFGINAPPNDRIQLQRTTICAPLDVDRFTNTTAGTMTDEKITGVYFGPKSSSEYTFMVSNYETVAKPAYHLDVVWSYPANGSAWSSTFIPIAGLSRNDADVSVVFLNNHMMPIKGLDGPCRDPFFSATNQTLLNHKDYYWPDKPITAIGCTDQYAFGNPVTGQWTKPMAALDVSDWGNYTKDWNLSAKQTAAIASLAWSIGTSGGTDRVILGLETEALLAKKNPGVFSGFQNPIPNDQWKKEVDYWFNIGLAKLQLSLISIAIGPLDPTLSDLQNFLPSFTADRKDLAQLICSLQKVHNVEFKNYNFVGFIVFLVIGGGVVLVLPLLVQCLIIKLSKQSRYVLYWTSYGALQLQRMAMEAAGVNGWERLEDNIPRLNSLDAPAGDLIVQNQPPHPRWALLPLRPLDEADPLIEQGAEAFNRETIGLNDLPR